MSGNQLELIGGSINALVVRAKSRRFPGVLIQGDTLRNLLSLVEEMRDSAENSQEIYELSDEVGGILGEILSSYEKAMSEAGLTLPYPQPPRLNE